MTRREFDDKFAATPITAPGYGEAQLAQINDQVFDKVGGLGLFDGRTRAVVAQAFDDAFARARAA